MYRLQPILNQNMTSQVPEEHQVLTVFSVLYGDDRRIAAQLQKIKRTLIWTRSLQS